MGGTKSECGCLAVAYGLGEYNRTQYIYIYHYVNNTGHTHTIDNIKLMELHIHKHLEHTSGQMIRMRIHTNKDTQSMNCQNSKTDYCQK